MFVVGQIKLGYGRLSGHDWVQQEGERLVQHSKAMHARIKCYRSIHHPGNGLFHRPFPSVLPCQSLDF